MTWCNQGCRRASLNTLKQQSPHSPVNKEQESETKIYLEYSDPACANSHCSSTLKGAPGHLHLTGMPPGWGGDLMTDSRADFRESGYFPQLSFLTCSTQLELAVRETAGLNDFYISLSDLKPTSVFYIQSSLTCFSFWRMWMIKETNFQAHKATAHNHIHINRHTHACAFSMCLIAAVCMSPVAAEAPFLSHLGAAESESHVFWVCHSAVQPAARRRLRRLLRQRLRCQRRVCLIRACRSAPCWTPRSR